MSKQAQGKAGEVGKRFGWTRSAELSPSENPPMRGGRGRLSGVVDESVCQC